jgi:uncharacterized phiE125 gp8 family phage protein
MALVCIEPPATEPVSLSDAKLRLRVDSSDEDALIARAIVAAREYAENYTHRQLVTARYRLEMDGPPVGRRRWAELQIPRPPLASVESVRYRKPGAIEYTEIDPSCYAVDTASVPGRVILLDGWPALDTMRPGAIAVDFTAGTEPERVPAGIVEAILVMVGDAYENRSSIIVGTVSSQIARTADWLLSPYAVGVLS